MTVDDAFGCVLCDYVSVYALDDRLQSSSVGAGVLDDLFPVEIGLLCCHGLGDLVLEVDDLGRRVDHPSWACGGKGHEVLHVLKEEERGSVLNRQLRIRLF